MSSKKPERYVLFFPVFESQLWYYPIFLFLFVIRGQLQS